MPVHVSDGCQPRASRLFQQIRNGLEAHGYEIRETGEGWRRSVRIAKDGWDCDLKLREMTRQQPVTDGRWGARVVYVPNGVLAIRVGDYAGSELRDTKRKLLEDRVSDIVERVKAAHANHIECAREAKDRRVRERELEEAQAEETKRLKAREEALQRLAEEAEHWQRSRLIRDYVAEVERVLLTEFRTGLPEGARAWITWARGEGDRTDPVVLLERRIKRQRAAAADTAATELDESSIADE